ERGHADRRETQAEEGGLRDAGGPIGPAPLRPRKEPVEDRRHQQQNRQSVSEEPRLPLGTERAPEQRPGRPSRGGGEHRNPDHRDPDEDSEIPQAVEAGWFPERPAQDRRGEQRLQGVVGVGGDEKPERRLRRNQPEPNGNRGEEEEPPGP